MSPASTPVRLFVLSQGIGLVAPTSHTYTGAFRRVTVPSPSWPTLFVPATLTVSNALADVPP